MNVNEEQKRFRTSGELTSDLVREMYFEFSGKYRQSKTHKVLMVILAIEGVLLVAMYLHSGAENHRVLSVLGLLVAYWLFDCFLGWAIRRGAQMLVRRFEEESHTGIRGNSTSFTDTQVYLENHGSGGACYINLSEMKRLMKVKDIWVLVTKTAAFLPIFVDQLSETDQESVLALLKSNNPKIKIQLPKKK